MPAFGIGTPIFIVVQALISSFVYTEANKYGSRSPAVIGISVFVLGVAIAFLFNVVISFVGVELVLILLYLIAQTAIKRRKSSA